MQAAASIIARTRGMYLAAGAIGVALIALAYWPGLAGPFLFDDFANLNDLGAYGPMDDWRSFVYYLTSGTADPTGRPVALLSFLVDAQAWPADPWPFKRTNLVLHLLNTVLLAIVIARLQLGLRRQGHLATSAWTPLLAAFFWGAHPFFVSTTLYVVQREAMLPATFVLLAILACDRAVAAMVEKRRALAWAWIIGGIGLATLLGGLSKANGFLAPMLAGIAYLWCLRPKEQSRETDRTFAFVLGVPSVLVLAYLAHYAADMWALPDLRTRDWTLPERVMSQPRALWDYVFRLAIPRAGGGGLYVDDFQVSTGWLDPPTTLLAAIPLLASIVAAIAWRRRFPIATLAWIFFLAAHLLESSVIALELYFEHRNYLPAMLLGWPVAHVLLRPGPRPHARLVLAGLLAGILLFLTWQRAQVWGDGRLLTSLSATYREDSVRSQVAAAQLEVERGQVSRALARMEAIQRQEPDSATVAISRIAIECVGTGRLSRETLGDSLDAFRTARVWTFEVNKWLSDVAQARQAEECEGLGHAGLVALVDAALANVHHQGSRRRRALFHLRGQMALAAGHPQSALSWFNAALELQPDADFALVQAAALGNAGAQAAGVAHLDRYVEIRQAQPIQLRNMASLHQWLLVHWGYYDQELAVLRARLAADAGTAPTAPPGNSKTCRGCP